MDSRFIVIRLYLKSTAIFGIKRVIVKKVDVQNIINLQFQLYIISK